MAQQTDLSPDHIRTKVRQYIVETMLEGDARGFDDETPLTSGGMLDSFSIVQLILFIEEEFGIKIPHKQMVAADFDTIAIIAKTVVRMADA
jgi:methoxymalonate biosynthesis acyl carrier protein